MDFRELKKHCETQSEISARLIDEFLLYFFDFKHGLGKKLYKKMKKYKEFLQDYPEGWVEMLASQIIVHQIAKENGILKKDWGNSAIEKRPSDEEEFVLNMMAHPYKFSFCVIKEEKADNFFEMYDIHRKETFLLYSPGVSEIQDDDEPSFIYFVLRGFNGRCYQLYGIIHYFKGMMKYDFLYYGKLLDKKVETDSDLIRLIESDPFQFTLLTVSSEIPYIISRKGEYPSVFCRSDMKFKDFDIEKYGKNFLIQNKGSVYELKLKKWSNFPHFSIMYYDRKKGDLIITASTEKGYEKLIEKCKLKEYSIPQLRASANMAITAEELTGKSMMETKYSELFEEEQSPEEETEMENLNAFLSDVVEHHNSGKSFDIKKLASKHGIDHETASSIVKQMGNMF